MKINVKSPTRVDLAGGTLDCWPLYAFLGPSLTISVAIDIETSATITPIDGNSIKIHSHDLSYQKTFTDIDHLLVSQDSEARFFQKILAYWRPKKGFCLETSSQSPVGGGLGGSSSLLISILKAFDQLISKNLTLEQMVSLASNIEAQLLKTPTGTQDYYPPLLGGLNIISYAMDGVHVKTLDVSDFIEKHFMLVYTGQSHSSGINNWQVIKSVVEGSISTLQSLEKIRQVSSDLSDAIYNNQWDKLALLFHKEYDFRTQLTPAFSSKTIVSLKEIVLRAGAEAMKICGAGGGGCVLVLCVPEKRQNVEKECQKAGFRVLDIKPVQPLNIFNR